MFVDQNEKILWLIKRIAEDDYEAVNSGKLSIFKLKK